MPINPETIASTTATTEPVEPISGWPEATKLLVRLSHFVQAAVAELVELDPPTIQFWRIELGQIGLAFHLLTDVGDTDDDADEELADEEDEQR
jgi:hypothetical protein